MLKERLQYKSNILCKYVHPKNTHSKIFVHTHENQGEKSPNYAHYYHQLDDVECFIQHHKWELMKRTGMEDLSSIVRIRRITFAGHMLWLPLPKPASESIHWKHEKRTTKRDLATNIQGNQLEWCSQERVVSRTVGRVSSTNTPIAVGVRALRCVVCNKRVWCTDTSAHQYLVSRTTLSNHNISRQTTNSHTVWIH